MRPLWIALLLVPVIVLAALLSRFSREEVDRVEVRWQADGPGGGPGGEQASASLTPGARQLVPWRRGELCSVAVFIGGTQVALGTVTDIGMGLSYRQRSQAKVIEADQRGPDRLELTLVNLDPRTGKVARQVFLRVERQDGALSFEFPKD